MALEQVTEGRLLEGNNTSKIGQTTHSDKDNDGDNTDDSKF